MPFINLWQEVITNMLMVQKCVLHISLLCVPLMVLGLIVMYFITEAPISVISQSSYIFHSYPLDNNGYNQSSNYNYSIDTKEMAHLEAYDILHSTPIQFVVKMIPHKVVKWFKPYDIVESQKHLIWSEDAPLILQRNEKLSPIQCKVRSF